MALAFAILVTARSDFLDRAPLGDPYIQAAIPPIARPNQTMVLMTGDAPMGFIATTLPKQIPVLRVRKWLDGAAPRWHPDHPADERPGGPVIWRAGGDLLSCSRMRHRDGHGRAMPWLTIILRSAGRSASNSTPIWSAPINGARSRGNDGSARRRAGALLAMRKPPSPRWCSDFPQPALPGRGDLCLRQQFARTGRWRRRARRGAVVQARKGARARAMWCAACSPMWMPISMCWLMGTILMTPLAAPRDGAPACHRDRRRPGHRPAQFTREASRLPPRARAGQPDADRADRVPVRRWS